MTEISCGKTTYKCHFLPTSNDKFAIKAQPIPQVDPNLMSGHFANNISINRPSRRYNDKYDTQQEAYQDYLKKLEQTKPQLFKIYFNSSDINIDLIKNQMEDLKQSTYQSFYSPNEFHSRKKKLHGIDSKFVAQGSHKESTTYDNYFNKIEEFKKIFNNSNENDKKETSEFSEEKYKNIMYKYLPTYYSKICEPALRHRNILLENGKAKESPLDRYTLRRL
ncbi:uncharacterized protein LOC129917011 [Episyrphus balteatus]|uniref:uncharacterized protein LOC129917011 n=1 Tax=Episyrphus balteatus TaxID=286459 RepID=UPI002486278A|nr:uncharacterized protein LOC129917011 [Episyrphus balteatus]